MKTWTHEHLNKIFEAAQQGHEKAREQVCFFLNVVDRNQTEDERQAGQTTESNGLGFNSTDAPFGTSLARQLRTNGRLTDKQMTALIKMIRKYSRQILAQANALEKLKHSELGQTMHNVVDDPLGTLHYVPYWQINRDSIRLGD